MNHEWRHLTGIFSQPEHFKREHLPTDATKQETTSLVSASFSSLEYL